jgi:hypothetical protein
MTTANHTTQTPKAKELRIVAWGALYVLLSGAMIWGVQVMTAWQNR